jgi:Pyridoxamine 5'-phosphate oxidase
MTPSERDDFLRHERVCRVATVSADGRPHVVPLWYVWEAEEPAFWLYSIVNSRRWAEIVHNPSVSVVVDGGIAYFELHGVELNGDVEVVGDVPRSGGANAELEKVESLFGSRYSKTGQMSYDNRHAWLRLRPLSIVSWDFRKVGDLAPAVGNENG